MPYRHSRVLVSLAATAALGLAAGCTTAASSASAGSSGPVEKPDITVAVVPTTDSTGFYIALHDGLFAKEGLHVTYVPVASGERVINQQALGQVDISAGNYVSYIEAQRNYDHGLRATDIPNPNDSQIAADMDVFDEASVMQPGFVGLFTLPGSKIKNISDLAGKTIGLNAPGNVAYLLVASFLEDNGMSPSEVHFKYFAFPVMTQALVSHQVDVAFLAEPFVTAAEVGVGVQELTNLDEGANLAFPIEGYAVTKQWARKYPNTLAAFKRALAEGQQIADTNRAEAERAMEAFQSTDGVTPEIGAIMVFENYPLGPVDQVRLQRVADEMKQFGLISSSFNVREVLSG